MADDSNRQDAETGLPQPLSRDGARALLTGYLAGTLSTVEVEAFECFLFEESDFLDEVEEARGLRLGLQEVHGDGRAAASPAAAEAAERKPPLSGVAANDNGGWGFARLGQVALVLLGCSVFLNGWLLTTGGVADEQPTAIGSQLLLSVRSSAMPSARLAELDGLDLLLRIDLGREAPAAYRARLESPQGGSLIYPVQKQAEDLLYLVLSDPESGVYHLELEQSSPTTDDGTWQSFREFAFEVR